MVRGEGPVLQRSEVVRSELLYDFEVGLNGSVSSSWLMGSAGGAGGANGVSGANKNGAGGQHGTASTASSGGGGGGGAAHGATGLVGISRVTNWKVRRRLQLA